MTRWAPCPAKARGGLRFDPIAPWRRLITLGVGFLFSVLAAGIGVASAQTVQILDLQTNDLIYDPFSQRIYASVPSSAGPGLGDTITTINPFTREIEASVPIGSEPGPLAASDDGQYLYVGFTGEPNVRRYHIPTATAGLRIALGEGWRGLPTYAEDIEVLPGSAGSIAVARKFLIGTPRYARVAVFDDDVMRPETTTNDFQGMNRIAFSESPALLYGNHNESSFFTFWKLEVSPTGVTELESQNHLLDGTGLWYGIDIEFEDGLIYATSGETVDPDAMVLIGTYDARGPVEADAALGKVFFVDSYSSDGTTLKTFDLATFVLTDRLFLEGVLGITSSLIRWGDDGLAFRTSEGQVFLISGVTSEPQNAVCDVALNQASYTGGDAIVATRLRVANPTGTALAVEAKLWFGGPAGPPIPKTDLHPTGLLQLPPGYDRDFGPVTLATVPAGQGPGSYSFSCRLIDPVTGRYMVVDVNPFDIR